MASEIEQAFGTLAEAFSLTENDIHGEIEAIEHQIEELKEQIIQLTDKQQTLSHDRDAIAEMYQRYCSGQEGAGKIEF